MQKIIYPWGQQKEHNCFGCSPHNPIGLKLSFYVDGQWVCAQWQPDELYAGYLHVLHGGIQALMHDEISSWYIYTKLNTAGVTVDINVKYKAPAHTNKGLLTIRGKLAKSDKRFATICTELLNADGQVSSEALVTYRIYPPKMATDKLGYPGIDAFFEAK